MNTELTLVSSYPIGASVYKAFENYASLGFYRKLYYFKSINFSNRITTGKPIYEEVGPSYISSKTAYVLSFYFDNIWSKTLKKNGYVHVLDPGFFHLAKFKIPIIGTMHDLYPMDGTTTKDFSTLYKFYYRKDLTFINELLGVITVSEQTSKILKKFFPTVTTTTIHHWTQDNYVRLDKAASRASLLLPHSKFILLNVSTDSSNKNLEFLGKIVDFLNDNFLLIHLGSGTIPSKHRNRIMQIEKYIDEIELVKLYNSADLYLAPSTSDGFNQPIMEAVNCDLPVIASDIPIFREVLFNSPYLLPLNPELWVDMIVAMTNKDFVKEAISWQKSSIGNHYRQGRAKIEFKNFLESIGIIGRQ